MALLDAEPLAVEGDLAAAMVAGIGRFLDRELALTESGRTVGPADETGASCAARRAELRRIIGAVDPRVPIPALELIETTDSPALIASAAGYDALAIRWPVLDGVDGEGLWLRPHAPPVARVIALPDADWTPEQIAGMAGLHANPVNPVGGEAPSAKAGQQFARRLAEMGCEVIVPVLIDRADTWSGHPDVKMTNQPHREFLYRMAFELGRHVVGYEVQKVLALVDYFGQQPSPPLAPEEAETTGHPVPIGVYGYGEGGWLALHAAALDERIDAVAVSGAFRDRRGVWQEPIYRNVWRLLRGFGDADLAALVAPRGLVIEASPGPTIAGPPPPTETRRGAAPGVLAPAPLDEVRAEVARARPAYAAHWATARLRLVEPPAEDPGPGCDQALAAFVGLLAGDGDWPVEAAAPGGAAGQATAPEEAPGPEGARLYLQSPLKEASIGEPLGAGFSRLRMGSRAPLPSHPGGHGPAVTLDGALRDAAIRQRRQFEQLCRFTQRVLERAARTRDAFWSQADASSPETWQASCARYRTSFWDDVIGRLPSPTLPPNPRTRLIYEQPRWTGYEVTLDLWPDVFAYGVLLLPRDLREGERRPVVVCQHGLEGRPQDTIAKEGRPYEQFAARLAERDHIVYAPQNPYIGGDAFRVLQRKANPLGWSLFSFIVAQHQRSLEWLATLPFVDAARIAFYGLSYGGKTAMRVPALLDGTHGQPGYCLSICSGDFNEWIVKCASTELPMSYLYTGEYEMFEFDLGQTYNYAEMAGLIAPRPFMVERGHRDGVALDEWVAFEYAKVRRRYADLHLADRTEIAFFDGPHTIHGQATFAFLDRHLGWPPATG